MSPKEKGGRAKDWRKGKPVRVVRSEKFKKHSKFAPEEGCRYDGTYKEGINHLRRPQNFRFFRPQHALNARRPWWSDKFCRPSGSSYRLPLAA